MTTEATGISLFALLEMVEDEASFVVFVKALSDDFAASGRLERDAPSSPCGPSALGWENIRIDGVLAAAAAWAQDSTEEMRARSKNPWHRCAAILFMGKHDE